MGLWESALILVGVGIVSSRFKAGVGLGELGAGIQSLVSAPLAGTGTGLSSLAGGIRDIAETFGDLGRGLSDLFAAIPKLPAAKTGPPQQPGILPGNGNGVPLIPMSGGDDTTLQTGGGGNVPLPNGAWTPDVIAASWLSKSPPPAGQTLWMTRQEDGYWRYAQNVG